MSTPALVPNFKMRDGTDAWIPPEQAQNVVNNKDGMPGVYLHFPDGTSGVVPPTNLAPALKAGGMTEGQYQQKMSGGAPSQPPSEGFSKTIEDFYKTSPSDSLPATALKSAGATITSPILHPIQSVKGMLMSAVPGEGNIAESSVGPGGTMIIHALQGMGQKIHQDYQQGGAGYAAANLLGNIGGQAVLGGATAGLGKGIGAAVDAVPSTARAAATFNDLNTALAQQPVNLQNSLAPLQRAAELAARGRSLPTPIKALLERSQGIIDMTYPEARDYQSALSDMSANDNMSMSKSMKGQAAQLSKGLFDDIRASAEAAGRGQDYENAMKEYRQASTLSDTAKAAMKVALTAGVGYKAISIFHQLTGGH